MSEVKDAIVSIETYTPTTKDADRKFILALAMVISYTIMFVIPILTNNLEMFKIIAATISGPVGTIVGYYFGTKKD